MYAIVRAGGRQEKVAVGDVVTMDRVAATGGSTVQLTPVLLVDGDRVTCDADALAKVSVTGEVLEHTKGPKVRILRYKNKTGYRRRQGYRSKLTQVRITNIS
ncbi:MAG: 50S ribosomal protein L21 [Micrococcales bacterium]|nr:MAG: 50S ribosomal protein L21 [Micrococcales bacterium]PIE26902.1 MAG: 50S ribosomal protein L21 [Micrococcales bacterium]